MSKTINFILLQANVVFNQQLSLFGNQYDDTKEGRNSAFIDTINKVIEKRVIRISPRVSEYILVYKASISNNIIYCQLAKKTSLDTYTLTDTAIEQGSIDTYPPLDVFINTKYQQIAVQLNTAVLSVTAIVKNIKNLINSVSKDFSIFFNTIEDKKEFWDLVSNDELIKEISFDLVVPNFFGATEAASKLVSGAKNELNADSVELRLKNKRGGLKASINAIDSYVKYASTSGTWKLKTKVAGDTKYHIINSTDLCKKKEVEETILELVRKLDDNGQIGKELYNGLLERLDDLFEYEE